MRYIPSPSLRNEVVDRILLRLFRGKNGELNNTFNPGTDKNTIVPDDVTIFNFSFPVSLPVFTSG